MVDFSSKGDFDVHHGPPGTSRIPVASEQNVRAKSVHMSGSRFNGAKRGERETDRFPTAGERVTIPVRDLAE